MLDILLFRADQGGNPDLVRESQRKRYADVTLVDKVIEYDSEWRKSEALPSSSPRSLSILAFPPPALAVWLTPHPNLVPSSRVWSLRPSQPAVRSTTSRRSAAWCSARSASS
jgi:hypothetical protein